MDRSIVALTVTPYYEKLLEMSLINYLLLLSIRWTKTLRFINNTLILFQEIIIVPLDEVVSENNDFLLHLIRKVEAGVLEYFTVEVNDRVYFY